MLQMRGIKVEGWVAGGRGGCGTSKEGSTDLKSQRQGIYALWHARTAGVGPPAAAAAALASGVRRREHRPIGSMEGGHGGWGAARTRTATPIWQTAPVAWGGRGNAKAQRRRKKGAHNTRTIHGQYAETLNPTTLNPTQYTSAQYAQQATAGGQDPIRGRACMWRGAAVSAESAQDPGVSTGPPCGRPRASPGLLVLGA